MKLTWNWKVAGLVGVLMLLPKSGRAESINLMSDALSSYQTSYQQVDWLRGSCWSPGTLTVTDSASRCHPDWVDPAVDDRYILINGDTEGGNDIVWWDVAVKPETNYTFSSWAANVCCEMRTGSTPVLSWFFNGIDDNLQVTDGPGVPVSSEFQWFSGMNTVLRLALRNTNTLYDGNDFAVGGMTLTDGETPEPASMLLLGTGLALVARRYRHSTRRV